MVERKEKTKQESVALPISVISAIEKMADRGILSTSKSEIYRRFIQEGLDEIINSGCIEKVLKTRELLDKGELNAYSLISS